LEFAARALATDGRQGIYRINAATGAPTLVVADGGGVTRAYPEFSSDKTKIYYLRVARTAGSTSPVEWYVERDLATGQERELFQPPQSQLRFAGRSPDGGFVVAFTIVPESALMVIDTTTGLGRELRRVPRGNAFSTHGGVRWTPDSKALLVIESIQGRNELRRVPLEGKPHPLSIGVTNLAEEMIDVHPDGRQIAFLAGEPNLTEIRVLERVLKPNGSRYP
jgi:Tol biopolymer transport system component